MNWRDFVKVLSLFSGCGGMDIGLEGGFLAHKASVNTKLYKNQYKKYDENYFLLEKTGFETIFANDILPFAKSAWCNYFSHSRKNIEDIYHLESIVDIVRQYEEGTFHFPNNIDIVTGGFPCQDFSLAGKRKGFNSNKDHNGLIYNEPTEATRGKLYLWMKKVIEITKPKIFIAENVKGLTLLDNIKEIIQEDFRNIDKGYVVVDAKVLNAKDYGVAQNRERVIFIGISKRYADDMILNDIIEKKEESLYYPYPKATHGNTQEKDLLPYATLKDILGHLPEPELSNDKSQQSYSKAKLFKNTQGNSEINLYGQAPTIRAEHHGNIEFRRLSKENGGKIKEEYSLPQRRLTVRECALIQSFPPDYDFVFMKGRDNSVSASAAYKIIGNAVPPLLGFALAIHLKSLWNDLFISKNTEMDTHQLPLF